MSTPTSLPLDELDQSESQSVCADTKACLQDTLNHTEAYVRENPIPVLLGALAFGVALGCTLAGASRREVTLKERLLDQRVSRFRDALQEALTPVADHLKADYAAAQKCVDRNFSHAGDSWTAQLSRFGRNLKFW